MNDVLLTVSGTIDPQVRDQVARGERPEPDYLRMAQTFGADLIDYAVARRLGGRTGRLLEVIGGPNLCLAWACYRQRRKYRVIFTDGEQVGIPLAGLLKFANLGRRPAHLMISHILSVGKKIAIFDWFKLASHVDIFFVYSTWQKQFIEKRWKVPPQRVVFTPFMVDSRFFAPENHSKWRSTGNTTAWQTDDLLGWSGIPGLPDFDRSGARFGCAGCHRGSQPLVEKD